MVLVGVLFDVGVLLGSSESFEEHVSARWALERERCGWVDGVMSRGGVGQAVYERAPTGLADIFSSLLTAFWYATLSGRRLRVHWPESAGTVALGGLAFESSRLGRLGANATYFKRSHEAFREKLHAVAASGRGRRFRRDGPRSASDADRDVVLSGNRGLTQWLFEDEARVAALRRSGVTAPDAIRAAGCALHRLAAPTREAWDSYVRPLLEALAAARREGPVVCLHARTGLMPEIEAKKCAGGAAAPGKRCARPDDEMHRRPGDAPAVSVDDLGTFVECAVAAEAAVGGRGTWFLAADSESLRRDFKARFGAAKVLLAPWQPDPFAAYQHEGGSKGGGRKDSVVPDDSDPDRMTRALGRTFAEWYALSRCDVLVASRSGFSRTAAVVALALNNASVHYVSKLDAPCKHATPGSPTARLLVAGGAGM